MQLDVYRGMQVTKEIRIVSVLSRIMPADELLYSCSDLCLCVANHLVAKVVWLFVSLILFVLGLMPG